jgi:phage terminase small subunit
LRRQSGNACLTPRQVRFVDEYLLDLVAAAAAVRAGYRAKSADRQAWRLLRNARVQAAIAERQRQRAERTGVDQVRVLNELELLAFSDLTHYRIDDRGRVTLAPGAPAEAMRALRSIKQRVRVTGKGKHREVIQEIELQLWDKVQPLKLAGQHVGLFAERHEHTGKDGKPIETVTRVTFGGRWRKDGELPSPM